MNGQWYVHKFGGSSLADASRFTRVANLILAHTAEHGLQRVAVVVSAMGGMTDALLRLATLAEQDDQSYGAELNAIGARYSEAARTLLDGESLIAVLDGWSKDAQDIRDVLKAIALVRSAPQRSRDVVAGYGEIWSARLLAAVLARLAGKQAGTWIDAREILIIRQTELGPAVLWDASRSNFSTVLAGDFKGITVITGFIATDEDGLQTTLGRNGSDFSAAIFAALCKASELTIWTDVDGVMSADPNRVPEARIIDCMTYSEAMELAYFGAKVIHPQTLGPVVDNDIPLKIRNTFNPAHPGTLITKNPISNDNIKGITAIGNMALVNLEGAGMIGVPGTADRMFSALKKAGVSVTLISQASSEHSICIAVPQELAARATMVIKDAFAVELASGQIQSVDRTDAQSIVAVVGDGMKGTPGIASRFFGTLARAGINVRAIAQGSSEINISAVVDAADATRALRAAHSGFYLSSKTISVGLIGPGTVGSTLLRQIEASSEQLKKKFNLDIRVRAIARSGSMLLSERRIDLDSWQQSFSEKSVALDFAAFEQCVNPDHLPHAVMIDCTASDEIASRYLGWLERGIHVITPNKRACSGPLETYRQLQSRAHAGSAHFFYENTVGAALPIISTLRDLVDTGDEIRSVQGIFSGTLAYLFNVYDGSVPFSTIVRQAKESGYTEPDPRDDLSGMDVARKLTILARELGMTTALGDFPVQNLVPEPLRHGGIDEFLAGLVDYDDAMQQLYDGAQAAGKVLRYIGRLSADGTVVVGLEAIDASHPFGNINLTDNIVQFETRRYSANPLYVRGPGAGPDVTAGGVFSELLRLAKFLSVGV
ncbi:MAG: bifunctional aspartate kinase/homoserine dehydrogenase I [Gammaproteobacteria bacterium]|nr:bifunctional aspartate kinase/homoserine dehydrogenase I [Gammaproteobacteria bacterium]